MRDPIESVAETERLARANRAMERYADGDDRAFSVLCDELEPRLRRFLLSLRSTAATDDVIHSTLLEIHRSSRARFPRGAQVLPWACAIAHDLIRRTLPDTK